MRKSSILVRTLFILLSINALNAYAQENIFSEQTLNVCTSNCLDLKIPSPINLGPIYLNPSSDQQIGFAFNNNLGQSIVVSDINGINQSWILNSFIGPLSNNESNIPYQNIGIATYTQSSASVDTTIGSDIGISAPLDKNLAYNDFTNNNLSETDFYFAVGSNPLSSNAITLMQATPASRLAQFKIGLGFLLKLSETEVSNLSNGKFKTLIYISLQT